MSPATEQVWRVVADRPDALKLIATWPRAGADVPDPLPEALPPELLATWHVLSQVFEEDIEQWYPTLRGNEIIGPAGAVDETIQMHMEATLE